METAPSGGLDALRHAISEIVRHARGQVVRAVNTAMVETYWQIGRVIVEHEQEGSSRAAYGKRQLEILSEALTREFGKGFDVTNLRNMRRFFLAFPIRETVSLELSWSHYNSLSRIEDSEARCWYEKEAREQNWSVRALQRQIEKFYYERLLASQEKITVREEASAKTEALAEDSFKAYLRDPYILDFLDLPGGHIVRKRFGDSSLK